MLKFRSIILGLQPKKNYSLRVITEGFCWRGFIGVPDKTLLKESERISHKKTLVPLERSEIHENT